MIIILIKQFHVLQIRSAKLINLFIKNVANYNKDVSFYRSTSYRPNFLSGDQRTLQINMTEKETRRVIHITIYKPFYV